MIPYSVKDLTIVEPTPPPKAKSKVVKEISNAWKNTAHIDCKGWVWVSKDKLHSILRTTKKNVEYIFMQFPDESKATFGNNTYVRGYEVMKFICKSFEENATGTKLTYLETSKQYYDSISSCDKAKLLRLEYEKEIKKQIRNLKKERMKTYNIKNDELTNEPLNTKTAEFSHIRSVSMHPDFSAIVENGLVVNKETHKIITSYGINDENELLNLCYQMNWSTLWYNVFMKNFSILLN